MTADEPAHALAWSGGKDSTLALHRALRSGVRVTHLFNIYDGETGRMAFHGVRRELIEAQAEALGLELVQEATGAAGEAGRGADADPGSDRAKGEAAEDADEPARAGEVEPDSGPGPDAPTPFALAFGRCLDRLEEAGVEGIVFGNIHLADVRAWYERRTTGRGLEHVEPLWGGDPARLAREFVTLGYRARVVSVMLESGDPAWLGRDLDAELLAEIAGREDVDPCGERGEFHTFCWDGPLFRRAVPIEPGEAVEMKGHRLLDLVAGEGVGAT